MLIRLCSLISDPMSPLILEGLVRELFHHVNDFLFASSLFYVKYCTTIKTLKIAEDRHEA